MLISVRSSRRFDVLTASAIAGLLLLISGACSGAEKLDRTSASGEAPTTAPQETVTEVDASRRETLGSGGSARLDGIDVSEFQGEIDWQAVKASGIFFAFARAVEGETIHDSRFADNWEDMKEAGVVRGAYDFYIADDSPVNQVEVFAGLVTLEPGDLAPMVDIEQASLGGEAPPNLVADFHQYLDLMEGHYGVKPIIYTDPNFWNENLDDSFGEYALWVADYDVDSPSLPEGWTEWVLWQHSEQGSVPGIDGDVDLDVFNGGLEELARYRLPASGSAK